MKSFSSKIFVALILIVILVALTSCAQQKGTKGPCGTGFVKQKEKKGLNGKDGSTEITTNEAVDGYIISDPTPGLTTISGRSVPVVSYVVYIPTTNTLCTISQNEIAFIPKTNTTDLEDKSKVSIKLNEKWFVCTLAGLR